MQIDNILSELRAERVRIDRAIKAIESLNSAASGLGPTTARRTAARKRNPRRMSAAARKRLSELMKKRWASGKMGKRKKVA